MRAWVLLLGLLAGCGYAPTPAGLGDDILPIDGPVDMPVFDPDSNLCFGTSLVKLCLPDLPTTAVNLPNPLSTDSDCMLTVDQTTDEQLCVIAGTTIDVATTRATGMRPLVLVAVDTITVTGALDVSSHGVTVGAGAGSDTCKDAMFRSTQAEGDSGGGGGGGGGGFGTVGGNGALGDNNDNHEPFGHKGVAGLAGMQQPVPAVVRGGCPGAAGGGGVIDTTQPGGAGAAGGGAVYLIARGSITIAGTAGVFASGAGGQVNPAGAGFEQGGGGGGSGGMIGLDAPAVTIDGVIAANGGGGGGGGGNVGGTAGGDGTTNMFNQRAAAGIGDAGGSGGDGEPGTAIGAASHSTPPTVDAGGGGGSGGLGILWIDGVVSGGSKVSPSPTAH